MKRRILASVLALLFLMGTAFAAVTTNSAYTEVGSGVPATLGNETLTNATAMSSTTGGVALSISAISGQTGDLLDFSNFGGAKNTTVDSNGTAMLVSSTMYNPHVFTENLSSQNTTDSPLTIYGQPSQLGNLLNVNLTNGGTNELSISPAGVATFAQPIQDTAPCATGYTHAGLNFCAANTGQNEVALNSGGICETFTPPAAMTGAKLAVIQVANIVKSSDVALTDDNTSTAIYNTSNGSCGTLTDATELNDTEQVAVTAGTTLSVGTDHLLVPVNNGAGSFDYRDTITGSGSDTYLSVVGYYQ